MANKRLKLQDSLVFVTYTKLLCLLRMGKTLQLNLQQSLHLFERNHVRSFWWLLSGSCICLKKTVFTMYIPTAAL